MRTEKSDPDRVYQNIPPAKQKRPQAEALGRSQITVFTELSIAHL